MRRTLWTEGLEHRDLPSVSVPGIVATDPADGARVPADTQQFTITFDPSVVSQVESGFAAWFGVDPSQVPATIITVDAGLDVEIDQLGSDGTATPYAGGAAHEAVQESIATTTDADGTTQTSMVVTLPSDLSPMPAGNYQLDVLPGTLLSLAFASVTADMSWFTATAPIPIAQFTVEGPSPTLAGATDLGTVGAAATDFWGSIQPSDSPSAVELFRFELPQGSDWQLDAQALSAAIGSRLPAALSLFGPDGTVLATAQIGTGSSGNVVDPALIQDLPGGTYYLGVSGAGNVPGTPQGYDPVAGTPGNGGTGDPAGVYELQVWATPAPQPTTLVDFNLDHLDPTSPSPTGLDLTFSGPVDTGPLIVPDQQETAVTVVDASGRTWPIGYEGDPSGPDALSFLFDEPLPAGTYSVEVPAQGGLTDVAGQPVAGAPGVLATFTVAAPSGPANPDDLGVVWPGATNQSWAAGISRTDTIAAGQTLDESFVVSAPGLYELQTQVGAGSAGVRILSADGTAILDDDVPAGLDQSVFNLGAGVYTLQWTGGHSEPATVAWQLVPLQFDYEKIAANGVGQSPATSLDLVVATPTAPAPASEAAGPSSVASPVVNPTSAATGAVATGSPASAALTGLLVTPETGLAGLPTSGGWQTVGVGPLADGDAVALADAGRGLPAGLVHSSSATGSDPLSGPDLSSVGLFSVARAERSPGSDGTAAASARADAVALAIAQADPMIRFAGWFVGRLPSGIATPGAPDVPAADLDETLLAAAGPAVAAGPDAGVREILSRADLGVPFALLVGTALTYRFSQPVRKWWRRHHTAHPTWRAPHAFSRARQTAGRR